MLEATECLDVEMIGDPIRGSADTEWERRRLLLEGEEGL